MTERELYDGDPVTRPAKPGQKCSCGQQAVEEIRLTWGWAPICVDKQTGRVAVRRMLADGVRYLYDDIGADGAR